MVGVRTVIVQLPGSSRSIELSPGQSAAFGRGAPELTPDLVLTHPGVSRLAGTVRAVGDYWLISNFSSGSTYVVENPEGAGEFVKVPPRRLELPVPFEFARVLLQAGGEAGSSFLVFAPQHGYADPADPLRSGAPSTVAAFPLDETAKYFVVLVALCEPRLRGTSVAIPSTEQVAARLRQLPGFEDMTARAVDFHVDYLARTKLRLRAPDSPTAAPAGPAPTGAGFAERREMLVSFALRFGLVCPDHLALLPARGPASGR